MYVAAILSSMYELHWSYVDRPATMQDTIASNMTIN